MKIPSDLSNEMILFVFTIFKMIKIFNEGCSFVHEICLNLIKFRIQKFEIQFCLKPEVKSFWVNFDSKHLENWKKKIFFFFLKNLNWPNLNVVQWVQMFYSIKFEIGHTHFEKRFFSVESVLKKNLKTLGDFVVIVFFSFKISSRTSKMCHLKFLIQNFWKANSVLIYSSNSDAFC